MPVVTAVKALPRLVRGEHAATPRAAGDHELGLQENPIPNAGPELIGSVGEGAPDGFVGGASPLTELLRERRIGAVLGLELTDDGVEHASLEGGHQVAAMPEHVGRDVG